MSGDLVRARWGAGRAGAMVSPMAMVLLLLPIGPSAAPPACDTWSARPCWAPPALDCAFRGLTKDLGARLLAHNFGHAAVAELEDAMQLARYCPALPLTQRPPMLPDSNAGHSSGAPACNYKGAGTGKVHAVAPEGGNDGGAGTLSAPFKTVARAVAASRQRKVAGDGATIVLLPGTHYLGNATVELDERDSGLVLTGCAPVTAGAVLPTILSAGRPLNASGVWEAVPGNPGVSMMRHAFGGQAIDGLFLSSASTNVRLVRARHPNSNPERVIWPSGAPAAGAQQYPATQYIGPEMLRYPESWLPPPAWQLEAPQLIEIRTPNWNGISGGLPASVNFTQAGGMSPYYQARTGGPMNRFVGGINPGPTRTNCLLTAIGRPYPAGCAVPGGVKFEAAAFEGAVSPRNWSDPSTGRIHAIHPLGCPVSPTMATPWFDWWWQLSHVQQAPPAPPPTPPVRLSLSRSLSLSLSLTLSRTLSLGACGKLWAAPIDQQQRLLWRREFWPGACSAKLQRHTLR